MEKKENLNFGEAIEALKQGKCVARKGWNGKGMCLWLNKGSHQSNILLEDVNTEGVSIDLFERGDEDTVTRLPNINMKTASGSTVTGWLASQTDMLAEDWEIVE